MINRRTQPCAGLVYPDGLMTSLFRITHRVLVLLTAGRDVPALPSLGDRVTSASLKLGEIMKFRVLVFSVIAFGLTSSLGRRISGL